MIKPFRLYLRRYLARHFNSLRLARLGTEPVLDRPTVLYANHPSWWDPVVLLYVLTTLYPTRRFFGPMDATAVARYSVLRRFGVFPIEPGSAAGAAEFRRQARALLAVPDAVLCVTAQGALTDPRSRPLRLKRGVAHLLATGIAEQAVPIALEYPFWQESKPEALMHFGPAIARGPDRDALHGTLTCALDATLEELARASIARDAAAFDVLVTGARRGVGGVYDAYRRIGRWAVGRRFDPSHEAAARGG